jgi:hypothetical protein
MDYDVKVHLPLTFSVQLYKRSPFLFSLARDRRIPFRFPCSYCIRHSLLARVGLRNLVHLRDPIWDRRAIRFFFWSVGLHDCSLMLRLRPEVLRLLYDYVLLLPEGHLRASLPQLVIALNRLHQLRPTEYAYSSW